MSPSRLCSSSRHIKRVIVFFIRGQRKAWWHVCPSRSILASVLYIYSYSFSSALATIKISIIIHQLGDVYWDLESPGWAKIDTFTSPMPTLDPLITHQNFRRPDWGQQWPDTVINPVVSDLVNDWFTRSNRVHHQKNAARLTWSQNRWAFPSTLLIMDYLYQISESRRRNRNLEVPKPRSLSQYPLDRLEQYRSGCQHGLPLDYPKTSNYPPALPCGGRSSLDLFSVQFKQRGDSDSWLQNRPNTKAMTPTRWKKQSIF